MTKQTLLTKTFEAARAFFRNTRTDTRIRDNPFSIEGIPFLKETRYFTADTGRLFQKSYSKATQKDLEKYPYVKIPKKEIHLPTGFARTMSEILNSKENTNEYAQS